MLTSLIRPVATWETTPITISGSSAMIGLRKISSSRIKISARVAISTIFSALLPDCSLSSACAAVPVTPSVRSLPFISGLMSARSTLTASPESLLSALTTLLLIETSAVWTSPLADTGLAVTPRMLVMWRALSAAATKATRAESALVSLPPSARANTTMAASAVTLPACGNAWS